MSVDPGLDQLSREELVAKARELGARRPEVMTRVELRDEIVRLSEPDPAVRRRSRGWLGVARDLVASVVDAGMNLPGAAAAIRGDARPAEETTGPPPVATLTLAEIYLAQGHVERALGVLDEVLATEPEHAAALALRARIMEEREGGVRRRAPSAEAEEGERVSFAPVAAPFVAPPPAVEAELVVAQAEPVVAQAEPVVAQAEPRVVEAEPTVADAVPAAVQPVVPREEPPFDLVTEAPPFVAVPRPHLEVAPPAPPQTDSAADAVSHGEAELSVVHVPTLAAPAASPAAVPAEPAVEAACALVQRGAKVEGLYRLPRGVERALLRVVWFVPGKDGPSEGNLDLAVDAAESRVTLPPVEQGAHVRGALGVEVEGAFKPLAVAWVYRASDVGLNVEFAPPGVEPAALRDSAQLGRGVADSLV